MCVLKILTLIPSKPTKLNKNNSVEIIRFFQENVLVLKINNQYGYELDTEKG